MLRRPGGGVEQILQGAAKRDQIAAKRIAPRTNMSSGTQDCRLLFPVGMDSADCATKWPT
ncbi:hypothetical protein GCM10011428_37770 [Streptomyces violaceus]